MKKLIISLCAFPTLLISMERKVTFDQNTPISYSYQEYNVSDWEVKPADEDKTQGEQEKKEEKDLLLTSIKKVVAELNKLNEPDPLLRTMGAYIKQFRYRASYSRERTDTMERTLSLIDLNQYKDKPMVKAALEELFDIVAELLEE